MGQIRRRQFLIRRRDALAGLLALGIGFQSRSILAQAATSRVAKVAYLSPAESKDKALILLALCNRLAEIGWIEGKTISYDWRFFGGKPDRLPQLAAELVAANPDVLVTGGNYPAQAAIRVTSSIPIVMLGSTDPLGVGFTKSLARPTGNVTGVIWADPGVAAKIVEITRAALPTMRHLAVLYDANFPGVRPYIEADRLAAAALGIIFHDYAVRSEEELVSALNALKKDKIDAVKAALGGVINAEGLRRVLEEASKNNVPIVSTLPYVADQGALLVYSPADAEVVKIAGAQVTKILRGSKPAEIPFEYTNRMELIINLRTAKTLGLTIPQSVLLRADRVID